MRWKLSDGTVVESGGRVLGDAKAAFEMRAQLDHPPAFVDVGPLPDGRVQLDPSNDFLLDSFVRGIASWLGLEVETDYVRKLEDAPPDVQELVRDLETDEFDSNAVY